MDVIIQPLGFVNFDFEVIWTVTSEPGKAMMVNFHSAQSRR